ncbi:MAG: hypothetical protein ACM3VZ_15330 [Acidobacteriota bacterium]
MRRWIAILMLVVLPLQLSWAVAATYCMDEEGAGAQHFGHHFHGQDHEHAHPGKKLIKAKQQACNDCGCAGHLCGAQLVSTFRPSPLPLAQGESFDSAPVRRLSSVDPPRIERPNWPVAL